MMIEHAVHNKFTQLVGTIPSGDVFRHPEYDDYFLMTDTALHEEVESVSITTGEVYRFKASSLVKPVHAKVTVTE